MLQAGFTCTTFMKVRIELKKASTLTKSSQEASKKKIKKERELLRYLVFLQNGSLILFSLYKIVISII